MIALAPILAAGWPSIAQWQRFCDIMLALLSAAFALALVRLARGPTLVDRVVALDVMVASAVAATALYAVAHCLPVLLDVAIVLALVTFIGSVGIARFLERSPDQ